MIPLRSCNNCQIRRELDNLHTKVEQLRHDLDESLADQRRLSDELRTLKDALGA